MIIQDLKNPKATYKIIIFYLWIYLQPIIHGTLMGENYAFLLFDGKYNWRLTFYL
jgi:hypothetical protein